MDKELKKYLDEMNNRLTTIEGKMASKDDLELMASKIDLVRARSDIDSTIREETIRIRKNMVTKEEFKKAHQGLLDYIAVVDENVEKHRKNTELHAKVGMHGF